MAIEIEAKVLETSHKDYESKLFEMGAKKIFEGVLNAIFVQKDGQEIRIREQNNTLNNKTTVIIEHKNPVKQEGPGKKMEERKLQAETTEEAIKFFEDLGFKKIRETTKNRVSYLIEKDGEKVRFDFDEYTDLDGKGPEIPELLEIESDNYDIIKKYAKKLGINENELLDWNARKLAEYYREKNINSNFNGTSFGISPIV